MIDKAGFDGICTHFHTRADVEQWIGLARERGFVIEGQAFPRDVDDLRPALELAAEHEIHHLTIQLDVRPYDVASSLPILAGWQELSKEYGVPVLVETHRGMMTNDLWSTREMIDKLGDLPLLADLSHYVCGQEMTMPISPVNQAMITRILRHARGFHGRVSSAEQIQIEIGFPCHKPWVDQFSAWWAMGFSDWLARGAPGGSLTFTVELGPKPYAISGPDGNDLSNRWEDALRIREIVLGLWSRVSA
ncbi:MAG: sugar phosphate isomerase/epimerase [Roseovarius sp.]|uniref:sugar phosphate isomerase/epimerase family protein n=1 Tax=Roseovarius sp. TaxID=1486281 RepID=UPI0032EEFF17